jgi:hypothetical protein
MKNILALIAVLFFISMPALATTTYDCWQEDMIVPNQSGTDGSCNLKYDGNYSCEGTWVNYPNDCENHIRDGTTAGGEPLGNTIAVVYTGEIGYYYFNYSKPDNAIGASVLMLKNSPWLTYSSADVAESCWNAYPDKVVFELKLCGQSTGCYQNSKIWCNNGSEWVEMATWAHNVFWEEAMNWKIYVPPTPTELMFGIVPLIIALGLFLTVAKVGTDGNLTKEKLIGIAISVIVGIAMLMTVSNMI